MHNIEEVLIASGFKIFSRREKIEYDLDKIEGEKRLIGVLKRYFTQNPEAVLNHPVYGEVTVEHKMLQKPHLISLEEQLSSLLIELKKERIKAKKKEVNFKIIKDDVDEEDKGAEVINLHGN